MDYSESIDEAKVIIDQAMRDAIAGYVVINLGGVVLSSNQAFCAMLGHDMPSFHGTDFKQCFRENYRGLAADWLAEIQSGADVNLRQLSGLLHADGSTRMIDLNASIDKDERGLPARVVLAAWDVTEILSRGSRTKAAKNMLELALGVNRIGTWEHVPDTGEFTMDATAETLFGYAKGTYPKRSFTEHLQHHMPIALDEKLRDVLAAFTHPDEGRKESTLTVKVRLIRQADGTASWMRIGERIIDHPVLLGAKKVIGTVQDVDTEVKAFIKL
ncbi:PAS domain S-box protein [Sulfitobacter sp. JBTF-M27]|uniref:PAS domain S-box protein n=1 Tax=Sulfitobacter sediminilitoris TaxID=2698830 RepID=A0A6P0CFP5_9RHOB|nr:PAS domain-containing protein [Sulfitobacter sediminilitoris]NEK24737.1 PAS domain S-box protein [Sulfitobacter sediminilitoris]